MYIVKVKTETVGPTRWKNDKIG